MRTPYFAELLAKHLLELTQRRRDIERQIEEATAALRDSQMRDAG
jgi:hypothetical protein